MTIYHSRAYLCDFCPKEINTEQDGLIIFGSVCVLGDRGLKSKLGEVPVETNIRELGERRTCICWKCFSRKLTPP